MASLAGKPSFGTDEPGFFYETTRAPQPRLQQAAPADPNKGTSYEVYNNYTVNDKNGLAASTPETNRNSGIGALLMSLGDESDSDDDEEDYRRRPTNPPGISGSPSKNATLAIATGAATSAHPSPAPPMRQQPQPQPQQQQQQRPPPQAGPAPGKSAPPQMRQLNPQQPLMPQLQHQQPIVTMRGPPSPNQPHQPQNPHQQQRPPQPIAAPRPGYAAPMAALISRPEAAAAPSGRMPPPAPIRIPMPGAGVGAGGFVHRGSPSPSTPHPLLPPVTPITPAFIRPSKSPVPGSPFSVSFSGHESEKDSYYEGVATPRIKPIMRGNSEETLLPKRGEKGDDFWRRFSMVVKEESRKPTTMKESSWLRKTRSGSARHSRWVWVVGLILILCIVGGIAVGIILTRNNPGHQQPTAIGGSADNLATAHSSASSSASKHPEKTSSSSLHVSPTFTLPKRDGEAVVTGMGPVPTPAVILARRHLKSRQEAVVVW